LGSSRPPPISYRLYPRVTYRIGYWVTSLLCRRVICLVPPPACQVENVPTAQLWDGAQTARLCKCRLHFADIELIAVLLIMAIWGCASVAIDHWVWAGRSEWRGPTANVIAGSPAGHVRTWWSWGHDQEGAGPLAGWG
jgi:hypothetical protein